MDGTRRLGLAQRIDVISNWSIISDRSCHSSSSKSLNGTRRPAELVAGLPTDAPAVAAILDRESIKPIQKQAALRGIADKIVVYEIP